ncbi:hypothetical protein [Mangrovicoccus ximenensis]|uniref:hypothetical protein n=1 Tax=Mangrovicoccus ximenensis TaxID=1911570 RepID=UPI000D3D3DEF|nr:hypothetical protein [Mangrovicoccus ximenensis]
MTVRTTATAVLLALAASTAAVHADQLSQSLGLPVGEYTTSELAAIKAATDRGDTSQVLFLEAHGDRSQATGVEATQLAAEQQLDPASYSPAQIAQIAAARADGNRSLAAYLVAGGSSPSGVSENAQLARSLGLPQGTYSDAQLAAIAHARDHGETFRAQALIDGTITPSEAGSISG